MSAGPAAGQPADVPLTDRAAGEQPADHADGEPLADRADGEPLADRADGEPLADRRTVMPVRSRRRDFDPGRVISVRTDVVSLPDGAEVVRDVVEHPGAVGVIALDPARRVLLLRQYRHPVEALLWEPPAGLLDHPGEDPLAAAARELYEEAGLRADRWDVLVDAFTSPGMAAEAVRIYLARDIRAVPETERYRGTEEEADLPTRWVALDDAVAAALAGRLHNPLALMGLLAAAVAARSDFEELRPGIAPWPARSALSPRPA